MNLNIVEERENKTLERKELLFEVENAEKTPSRQELRKKIAAIKGSKEELVSIGIVEQCYGEHRAKGKAYVYACIEMLKKLEPSHLIARESKEKKKKEGEEQPGGGKKEGEEKAPEEGKPAEGGKEGKPAAEEKKEEPKEEKPAEGGGTEGKKEQGRPDAEKKE